MLNRIESPSKMAVTTGANPSAGVLSPFSRRQLRQFTGISPLRPRITTVSVTRRPALSSTAQKTAGSEQQRQQVDRFDARLDEEGDDEPSGSVNDYFEQAAVLVESTAGGGGPRWFSPVECGRPRLKGAPLLFYLPGIDGVGLGLVRQHRKLGGIFEVWCLHIPVMDRTPFSELVKLVESIVRSEFSRRSPKRPIYLVGESIGGCLALAIAARNPDIDLVLILANPATSFSKSPLQLISTSQLQLLLSSLESMPRQHFLSIPSLLSGDPMRPFLDAVENGFGQSQAAKDLLESLRSASSYFSVITDILPIKTFLWKMEMLKDACAHANSSLYAIEAQTLILTSGRDPFLPSEEEGERLCRVLPKCDIRKFTENGHFLFLEDGMDLVYTLKCANIYRRGRSHDYVADYLPPTPSEFRKAQDLYWWYDPATSPVMLSTLENGEIVRGLATLPSEGPTLLVGYHMLMGFELFPLVRQIVNEKNIIVRGIAHPMFFKARDGKFPVPPEFEAIRLMGSVPVSGTNLFKLLASKSHVLLYPGGVREAFHQKGEEYQLFWPEQSEFVRMAARFGATIVPFGAVGEDDLGQLVLDYNDLTRIPYIKEQVEQLANEAGRLRTETDGEVSNQAFYLPGILPKVPGRLYYLFGKPIKTEGRRQELKDRQNAHKLYLEVKSEVEMCLAYLKEKREVDPYRSVFSRLLYQSTHGFTSEIPTFEH